jgi:hypothetical protein
MVTLNELKKKGQLVWIAAKPVLQKFIKSDFVSGLVAYSLLLLVLIGMISGIGWIWENVEAFRWLVGLGIVCLVLLFVAELAPLLIALAALVYLFKNC